MTIAWQDVTRDQILAAMRVFDDQHRAEHVWNDNYRYEIPQDGKVYPLKTIRSLATGETNRDFKGDETLRAVYRRLGFDVVPRQVEAVGEQSWLFQGNPSKFDVRAAVATYSEMSWTVSRHASDIKPGDCVWIWESGANAAILAQARVLDIPSERQVPLDGFEVGEAAAEELGGNRVACMLSIEEVLLPEIGKAELKGDDMLSNMLILRSPQGTNFRVTRDEHERLEELAQDRLSGPPSPRVWRSRMGSTGEDAAKAVELGIVGYAWDVLDDLSGLDLETIKQRVIATGAVDDRKSPDKAAGAQAKMLHSFASEMNAGDWVVTWTDKNSHMLLGRVQGDYEYRPEFGDHLKHCHRVKWLNKSVDRKVVEAAAPIAASTAGFAERSTVGLVATADLSAAMRALLTGVAPTIGDNTPAIPEFTWTLPGLDIDGHDTNGSRGRYGQSNWWTGNEFRSAALLWREIEDFNAGAILSFLLEHPGERCSGLQIAAGVDHEGEARYVSGSLSKLSAACDRVTCEWPIRYHDPGEWSIDPEMVQLMRKARAFAAEGPWATMLPDRAAWKMWLEQQVYITTRREGDDPILDHVAFYADDEIKMPVPAVTGWWFDATIEEIENHDDEEIRALVLAAGFASDATRQRIKNRETFDIYWLSGLDDEQTVTLEKPIVNAKVDKNGEPSPYVLGHAEGVLLDLLVRGPEDSARLDEWRSGQEVHSERSVR